MSERRESPQQIRGRRLAERLSAAPFRSRCLGVISGALDRERFDVVMSTVLQAYDGVSMRLRRLSDDRHAFFVSAPSVVADAASLVNLVREIAARYEELPLPDRPHYEDFAVWAHELLEDERTPFRESAAPSAVREQFAPRCIRFELSAGARSLDVDEEAIAAAWLLVTSGLRQHEQAPAWLGVTFSGRAYEDLDEGIGPYERVMPLRVALDGASSFARVAQQYRQARGAAARHEEYFDCAFREMDVRDIAPFAFDFRVLPRAERFGGIGLSFLRLSSRSEPCDLRLCCTETADAIEAVLEYDSSRWTAEEASEIGSRFLALLEDAAPRWPTSFHALVEQQVELDPDRDAVLFRDRSLSYGELQRRAWQLAHRLRSLKIRRGDRVAITATRSPELVIGILGILQAGAAYVPIDPSLPDARKAAMFEDAEVAAMVVPCAAAAVSAGCVVVSLDDATLEDEPAHSPGVRVTSDDTAYVLYTSGSTGRPKGVLVPHGALRNYVRWACRQYRLDEGSGAIVQSSPAFDLTVTSLLAPLAAGQRVILLPEASVMDALCAALEPDADRTLLKITPSQLAMLNGMLAGDLAGRVRTLVVGGERVQGFDLVHWLDGGTRVFNEYGPTEATVGCCVCEVVHVAPDDVVPIGRPISHTSLHVLDADLQPVRRGERGQLFVGGRGVARGYARQPALDAEAFLPDPFDARPGSRMYRTGDLARQRPDGSFLFEGRDDDQVKVNGVRIELGEIDAALRSLPGARQAASALRRGPSGNALLIGYVVADDEELLSGGGSLREGLARILPEALLPAAVQRIDALPLNANGKLDRDALPPWNGAAAEIPVPPADEIEAAVARVWRDVLRIERIGVDDDYFALGGDSIHAIGIVARAREAGVPITVAELFRHRTIRAVVAAYRERTVAVETPRPLMRFALLAPQDRERVSDALADAYPAALLQVGMMFHNLLAPAGTVYHDVFSYHLRWTGDPAALVRAARAMVQRHEVLRTTFDLTHCSETVQLVHRSGADILFVHDLRGLDARDQESIVSEWFEREKQRGFDVTALPLLRLHVHVRSEDHLQLTMAFHHAIIDGWSDVSLLVELFTEASREEAADVPPPATRYADFIALEQAAIGSREQEAFWANAVAGCSMLKVSPRPAGSAPDTIREPVPIARGISDGLKKAAVSAAVPVKTILLAAHMGVLRRITGEQDVMTALVCSGRPETRDGERVLGLFINSVPFRLPVSCSTWEELVQVSFEAERALLPHRRYPLAEITRLAGIERLSESLFYFTHYHVIQELQRATDVEVLQLTSHEASEFPLAANFWIDPFTSDVGLTLIFDANRFDAESRRRIVGAYARALAELAADPSARFDIEEPIEASVHAEIQRQADATPDAVAIVFNDRSVSYGELTARAHALARELRVRGTGHGSRVGICMERCPEMVIAILAVLESGAAYVPIEPEWPPRRMRQVIEDAGITVVIGPPYLNAATFGETVVVIDPWASAGTSLDRAFEPISPETTAYIIYTSGSTGEPKGVVVRHRNLLALFRSLDEVIGSDGPGVWLAISSITFDISIVELLWTLARGWKVVLQGGPETYLAREPRRPRARRPELSLFFFGSDAAHEREPYALLKEAARFADERGFSAVWMPERHFDDFGGLFANPAVAAAAVAAITSRLRIRAGSVVLPLHHPVRVAEDWSMVDGLSGGRVELAFASGWHRRDFLLAPDRYEGRHEHLAEGMDVVRRLWRGEAVQLGEGEAVAIHPRPIQNELPFWMASGGSAASVQRVGEMGAGLLTHLLNSDVAGLAESVAAYRRAGRGDAGRVAVMVHAFVGDDAKRVRHIARRPLLDFLRQSVELAGEAENLADVDALLARSVERIFDQGGLFGTPLQCRDFAGQLIDAGADEIACLIDFGIEKRVVLEGLRYLDELRRWITEDADEPRSTSVAAQIERHGVTHFQCTPTVAAVLLADAPSRRALGRLQGLLVGGEALPERLANELTSATSARILNMYGPTEATVWASYGVVTATRPVSIGIPFPGSRLYVLNDELLEVEEGELYIGGDGVAEGYLGRPELTAARFLPDPFVPFAGGRMYRTGDRCRRTANGELLFLGRTDEQVKIAGHRIELREIETVLAQHDAVADCAVVVVDGSSLTAFIVSRPGARMQEDELRRFVGERLPAASVPSQFRSVDAFPRTAAGKTDRQSLARLLSRAEPEERPRTATEERIAAVWSAVLRREDIGIRDNFFAIGGRSIQATMLVSRVRDAFQVELPLQALFDAPTVEGLSERVDGLARESSAVQTWTRRATTVQDRLPLTYAQERMWFVEQIAPGSGAYHDVFQVAIEGELDVELLRRCMDRLATRHDMLRASFGAHDGIPYQRVAASVPSPLYVEDLTSFSAGERRTRAAAAAASVAAERFDLAQPPLWRASLVRIGGSDSILTVCLHHLICDGWSLGIIVHELFTLYDALAFGETPSIAAAPASYVDYADWQRTFLRGERLQRLLDFWKERLADAPPALELTTDRRRPRVEDFVGAAETFTVPRDVVDALSAIAAEQRGTLFMALQAAFDVLLFQHTGRTDLVIGTDFANRNRSDVEGIIGFFTNELIVRTDLSGDPSYRALVTRVREAMVEAFDYAELPFSLLVDAIKPERDVSRNPLFQIAFSLQQWAPPPQLRSGITIRQIETPVATARLDLECNVRETAAGLEGEIRYATSLFRAETVRRLAAQFVRLLAAAVSAPDLALSELTAVSEEDLELQLRTWNDTARDVPLDRPYCELFEEQVARTPERPAVVDDRGALTYAALHARADAVARALNARGIGTGSLVAILMPRGADVLAAMLALLKIGAVYVPLDTKQGDARMAAIVEDCACAALIASSENETLARDLAGKRLLFFDVLVAEGASGDRALARPDSLAYVMYTSGSTGVPKGAMVEQRGMINHLFAKIDDLGLTADDVVAQTASLSFDISVWQFLAVLLAGGCVRIYDDAVVSDADALLRSISRDGVSVLEIVPTMLQAVLDEVERRGSARPDLWRLRWLMATGETLAPEACRRWLTAFPSIPVVNAYGPTECSDDVTHHFIDVAPATDAVRVPIGRPIANTRLYILNEALKPLPVGAVGELCVAGAGVGGGYLNRDAQTRAAFVNDPFASGGRMYRTGDFARYLPDGTIEFIGRRDDQVKVRGIRIETAEIESVLSGCEGIRECVVVPRADAGGAVRLVAYVACDPDHREDRTVTIERRRNRIAEWKQIYDDVYTAERRVADPSLHTAGWTSSASGQRLPDAQMRAWADGAAEWILRHRPRRVLEIGCGTGMLLFRIAPHCESYIGTDFSAAALDFVERHLPTDFGGRVRLLQRMADDFGGIAPASQDAVVLNSVVQYLPSAEDLERILAGAVASVRDGGQVFIGDVRSLPLLEAFHTWLELEGAAPSLEVSELRARVERGVAQEQELVLHPDLFSRLPNVLPRVAGVDIALKPGGYDNELSRFRYDVTLSIGAAADRAVDDGAVLDWEAEALTVPKLAAMLDEQRPESLLVSRIPNRRVAESVLASRLLRDSSMAMVGALRSAVAEAARTSIDPSELSAIPGYAARVTWSASGDTGSFDAFLGTNAARGVPRTRRSAAGVGALANDPIAAKRQRDLPLRFRTFLQERLPESMIPSTFVILDRLPRTASGKVDRRALPRPEIGRPESRQYVVPGNRREEILARLWSEVLRVDRVGIRDNFFELGGDSITIMQVVARANQLGLRLAGRQAFLHQTIEQLAAAATEPLGPAGEQAVLAGPVALTPVQLQFFAGEPAEPHHWNQAIVVRMRETIDAAALERAIRVVIAQHDALRLRFAKSNDGWTQWFGAADDAAFRITHVDLTSVAARDRAAVMERCAAEAQASLDLQQGPTLQVVSFVAQDPADCRLLLAVHHLCADGMSWHVLLSDLGSAYAQARRGDSIALPPKTASFRQWSDFVASHARSLQIRTELPFWMRHIGTALPRLPVDLPSADESWAASQTCTVVFGAAETDLLLREMPRRHDVTIEEGLLAGLLRALARWTGERRFLIELEANGRDASGDLELSRTIGWLTSVYPLLLTHDAEAPLRVQLASVQEQVRSVPNRGFGYGVLRYAAHSVAGAERLRSSADPELTFNYFGRLDPLAGGDELFSGIERGIGPSRSPRSRRTRLLELDTYVIGDRFHATCTHGPRHLRATIERFMETFRAACVELASGDGAQPGGPQKPALQLPRMSWAEIEAALGEVRFE